MTEVKLPLGWALAHLQTAQNEKNAQFAPNQRSYLEHVVNRLKILNSDGQPAAILNSLPERGCTSSAPYLENNDDYFIALFSNSKYDEACINLYNHLNNCYHCFEIFSQVLRDYYRHKPQSERFTRSENE
jgi:hypothetical protein